MRWIRLTTALLAAAVAGCASNAPSSVLAEGPRMIDLYRGSAVGEGGAGTDESPALDTRPRCRWWLFTRPCEGRGVESGEPQEDAGPAVAAYARTAANELELLFPRLPNPDIYIHVLPHLATEARVPVPGYTTAVPLYERVEYALPGELERANARLAPAVGAGGRGSPESRPEVSSSEGQEEAR